MGNPARYDIKLTKGTTYQNSFRFTTGENHDPVDLTGQTAVVVVVPRGDEADVIGEASIPLPQVGDAKGWVNITIDNSLTSLMTFEEAEWYLNLTDASGEPARKIEGLARVRD